MCSVFKISRSGYYQWIRRKPSQRDKRKKRLEQQVRRVFVDSRRLYGSTKIWEALKKKGAEDAYICATHGVFSADALSKLDNPNIKEVVVTDTIHLPDDHPNRFVTLSIAPLLATAVKIITEGGSIATLFKS